MNSDIEGGHERTVLFLKFGSGEKAGMYYVNCNLI